MSQSNSPASIQPELEWIQMKKDFDADREFVESPQGKFIRKFKQNPLVPIGKLQERRQQF